MSSPCTNNPVFFCIPARAGMQKWKGGCLAQNCIPARAGIQKWCRNTKMKAILRANQISRDNSTDDTQNSKIQWQKHAKYPQILFSQQDRIELMLSCVLLTPRFPTEWAIMSCFFLTNRLYICIPAHFAFRRHLPFPAYAVVRAQKCIPAPIFAFRHVPEYKKRR